MILHGGMKDQCRGNKNKIKSFPLSFCYLSVYVSM